MPETTNYNCSKGQETFWMRCQDNLKMTTPPRTSMKSHKETTTTCSLIASQPTMSQEQIT